MERIRIGKTSGAGYRHVLGVDAYVEESLDVITKNLVYLRASIVNGCTYCVDAVPGLGPRAQVRRQRRTGTTP